ncbi:hypothetical protein R1sor_026833 [Riccia sorocarpa]|uniref:CCHC-type domain-containing protein n=1 Tax=Riccia sorocarpa TaxID=122646 RepID=A0ABD3GFU3_9MARC
MTIPPKKLAGAGRERAERSSWSVAMAMWSMAMAIRTMGVCGLIYIACRRLPTALPSKSTKERSENVRSLSRDQRRLIEWSLITLNKVSEETGCEIYGKAEFLNPGGSVKNRAALFIIKDAEEDMVVHPTEAEGAELRTADRFTYHKVIGKMVGSLVESKQVQGRVWPGASRLTLDEDLAKQAFGLLKQTAVLLFTTEEVPSRDKVDTWTQNVIMGRRGRQVTARREISCKDYMILMATEQEKQILLQDPPRSMDGKAIMMMAWSPSYNYKDVGKASKQMSSELPNLDPLLLGHATKILQTLDQVLYHSVTTTTETRYAHIRACIMRMDVENLPKAVVIDLPWGGHVLQEIKYTFLPDTCFRCRQRGHRAAECTNTNNTNGNAAPNITRTFFTPKKKNTPAPYQHNQHAPGKDPRTPGKIQPTNLNRKWKPKDNATTSDISTPNPFQALQTEKDSPLPHGVAPNGNQQQSERPIGKRKPERKGDEGGQHFGWDLGS